MNGPAQSPTHRRQAEAAPRRRAGTERSGAARGDSVRSVHELEVRLIELEMQNDELRRSRTLAEGAAERYASLYESAPIGFFTVGRDATVAQGNRAAARLLGVETERLPGLRFGSFVAAADQPVFSAFLERTFAGHAECGCQIHLATEGAARSVQVEGSLLPHNLECRLAIADVTEWRHAEEEVHRLTAEMEERVRQRTETIREMASGLTLLEKQERARLSYLLHEHLQQLMVGAKFLLESVKGRNPVDDRRLLDRVKEVLSESIEVSRTLAVDLCPPVLLLDGFPAALRWLAGWMRDNLGLGVTIQEDSAHLALPDDLSVVLYQAVRELLFNVAKHAKVSAAVLRIGEADGSVRIEVGDQGVGFDSSNEGSFAMPSDHFGLYSVRKRILLLGGRFNIDSAPGRGCRITVSMPLPK
jgi:PAS domain S-box-containing protein